MRAISALRKATIQATPWRNFLTARFPTSYGNRKERAATVMKAKAAIINRGCQLKTFLASPGFHERPPRLLIHNVTSATDAKAST
mmetsp:Transcript_14394/g.20058  ORF Transcript_14394/g.20058 Transcript_14394/m.20058 type:complete len:85 (-) Transcript_14394:126-380(-)